VGIVAARQDDTLAQDRLQMLQEEAIQSGKQVRMVLRRY
jgi:hypothetical protein